MNLRMRGLASACAQPPTDYAIVAETPAVHARPDMARFVENEARRPSKQWINGIIEGNREQEEVVLRTDEFVLLPDTERVNRYWRTSSVNRCREVENSPAKDSNTNKKLTLNWLSIVHDRAVRTIRDLRGEHLPMLRRMLEECLQAIEKETGIPREQIMAYVHYPPSVYQMHVHFSHPYGQYCHRDAYRIHSLGAIINNLEIDSDYYVKATLYVPVYKHSDLYQALTTISTPRETLSATHAIAPPAAHDPLPMRGVCA